MEGTDLRKHFAKISLGFLILTIAFYFLVPTEYNYSSTTINTILLVGLVLTIIFAIASPKNIWRTTVLSLTVLLIIIFLFIAISFGISGL